PCRGTNTKPTGFIRKRSRDSRRDDGARPPLKGVPGVSAYQGTGAGAWGSPPAWMPPPHICPASPHRVIIPVLAPGSRLVCRRTPGCRRAPLATIRALAVRQARTFAGIPDTLALVPAPPFRGLFVLPAAPELPEEPGLLQLPFQPTQGKLHIVVMHRD